MEDYDLCDYSSWDEEEDDGRDYSARISVFKPVIQNKQLLSKEYYTDLFSCAAFIACTEKQHNFYPKVMDSIIEIYRDSHIREIAKWWNEQLASRIPGWRIEYLGEEHRNSYWHYELPKENHALYDTFLFTLFRYGWATPLYEIVYKLYIFKDKEFLNKYFWEIFFIYHSMASNTQSLHGFDSDFTLSISNQYLIIKGEDIPKIMTTLYEAGNICDTDMQDIISEFSENNIINRNKYADSEFGTIGHDIWKEHFVDRSEEEIKKFLEKEYETT